MASSGTDRRRLRVRAGFAGIDFGALSDGGAAVPDVLTAGDVRARAALAAGAAVAALPGRFAPTTALDVATSKGDDVTAGNVAALPGHAAPAAELDAATCRGGDGGSRLRPYPWRW